MIPPFRAIFVSLCSSYQIVGVIIHVCFVYAERDESRPYGWRMATRCIFFKYAERDESRPYGWRMSTR